MNKDWTGTQDSIFKQLGASNHCKDEREQNDYYATDPRAIDDLLKIETFDHNIWECANGGGHLSKRLRENGYCVWGTDIVDRGHQHDIVDFLKQTKPFKGDIITNPPYKFCTEFVLKALEISQRKVAMFLKLQTLEGQDRYNKIFSKYPPKTVAVYVKRIQCGKNGDFTGSSAVCYAWFIWDKEYKGGTMIKWIY